VLRLTAAVIATAAVANTIAGTAVPAVVDRAVRAEVAVADKGHPFDVRRIRIVGGLSPGESYRLPAFGIRNHRGSRTTYRLVVSAGAAQAERLPLRHWLHFVPAAVVIDAGRSRMVGARLELPDDAAPGAYAVLLGVRPGRSEGAHLTFRIEPAESTRPWLRQAENLAMWVAPTLVGALLVLVVVRRQQAGSKPSKSLRSTMRVRGNS
jgi:hypothetical protein